MDLMEFPNDTKWVEFKSKSLNVFSSSEFILLLLQANVGSWSIKGESCYKLTLRIYLKAWKATRNEKKDFDPFLFLLRKLF